MKNIRKLIYLFLYIPTLLYGYVPEESALMSYQKKRLIVLLDPNIDPLSETDDAMSLVRLMVYSNMFDIEGLIATVSHNYFDRHVEPIYDIIDAYQNIRGNLMIHESGFPDPVSLKAITAMGPADYGVQYALSEIPISNGAEVIIDAIQKDDSRPIWIIVWGDGAVIAQALEYIRKTEGIVSANNAASKLRVVDNAGQDDSGAWLKSQDHYPDLFYIRIVDLFSAMDPLSDQQVGLYPWCGECAKGNISVVTDEWVAKHIQSHGALGMQYPDRIWLKEGDSPTLLYLLSNGLNDPEYPWYGSWGGRMTKIPQTNVRSVLHPLGGRGEYTETEFDPYYMYEAEKDTWEYNGITYTSRWASLFRWWVDFQHDFAARMDWTLQSNYSNANHPPVVVLERDTTMNVFQLDVGAGDIVELSASKSYDPDLDNLSYRWWVYEEPGSYKGEIIINNAETSSATIEIPSDVDNDKIHIILSVTDDGDPSLTRYRRIILKTYNTYELDEKHPTIPSGLKAVDSTYNSISVSWKPSSDNVEVIGYIVYTNDKTSGATGDTTYTVNSLNPGKQYKITISAFDAESNISPESDALHVSTMYKDTIPPTYKDTIPPTMPSNLGVDRVTSSSFNVTWSPSQDNVGIDKYEVYINGEPGYSTEETFITISSLKANTTYKISVKAYDTSNNGSKLSDDLTVTTNAPDNEPPTSPQGLKVTEVTEKTISLLWNPSTDNMGIRYYKIYVNNLEWVNSTRTEITIEQLEPGLEYGISVSAVDESENESYRSTSVQVSTKNSDITTQPRLPSISIIDVQNNTIRPTVTAEISSLGFSELMNYGLELSETDNPEKETMILWGIQSTKVINESRIRNGLQVLYNFSEGEGNIVKDISGVEQPIDLNISNEGHFTEWLTGQGLRIIDNTIISHEGNPARLINALSATNEITLEAWIKQEHVGQSGSARLITLSTGHSRSATTLAHEGNKASYNYVAGLNITETDKNGTPGLKTSQNFVSSSLHHVVFTRNNKGKEKIYVNGKVLATGDRKGDFSSWEGDYQFALANELTGERAWKGIFYLVALYNIALTGEAVNQNYQSGFGQIRFTTELDTLKSNVTYSLKPFITTDQGLVYGEVEDFIYQNVAESDSNFSFYPNPNNGNIFINVKNLNGDIKQGYLKVIDFSGLVHYSKVLDLPDGLMEKSFELQLPTFLKNGLYSLILITGSRSTAQKCILMR